MTRSAFRATLQLENGPNGTPLDAVAINIEIKDATGTNLNQQFLLQRTSVVGADDLGTNAFRVNPDSTGVFRWLLVPSDEVAPSGPRECFVGGNFSYQQGTNRVAIPLEPIRITVYPDAKLKILYFHEREVFSDDPITPTVEPAVPYALVAFVTNEGAGIARNLQLVSPEPKVVSNEKGLLIDFNLVSSSLDGISVPPNLGVNFGQVAPGATRIAEWRFTSSLQGFFDDFKATLQHVDALGSPKISTVKSVSIHEMTHLVRAGYQVEDGRGDFLVNDDGDAEHLPDQLYLSNGSTQAVTAVLSASTDAPYANPSTPVTLRAGMPEGWGYLRIPEPSAGQGKLFRVLRSDGREISLGTNAWTTDRFFPGPGLPPVHEHRLHIFDFGGPGVYTLYYSPTLIADATPPTSRVKPLATSPPTEFPVMWEGEDLGGSGISYFDVFVSEDGGPFRAWLTRSTLRGSVFTGQPGRSYAFYSEATDGAGNREISSGGAQSSTVVGIGNQPPVIGELKDQAVAEGERLSVRVPARDPEGSTLRFAVAPGAPSGVSIDAVTGDLSWQTSESDGGTSSLITVEVTDAGLPAATERRSFRVQVVEQNTAPSLALIPDQFAAEGVPLEIQILGTDTDLPSQTLTYSLLGTAPTGAVMNAHSGLLTWVPTEEQGPSTNSVTVVVTDNGTPPKSAARAITIFVAEVNTQPVIATLPEQEVTVGQLLQATVRASDSDIPKQTLVFSLGADAPPDASIDAKSGDLRWLATARFAGETNEFTVVVTDNGTPALSAEKVIKVRVREQNIPPIAGRDFVATVEGGSASILSQKLLANDFDLNVEDLLSLTITNNQSKHGGSVTMAGTVVTYVPPTSFVGEDEFSYVLSDNHGGITDGLVDVLVRSQNDKSYNLISLTPLPGGRVRLRMIGKPETSYTIEYSDSLQAWQPLGKIVAGQDGIFEYTDESGQTGQRYYRLRYP